MQRPRMAIVVECKAKHGLLLQRIIVGIYSESLDLPGLLNRNLDMLFQQK